MTDLTRRLIRSDAEVYAASYGPVDGKYGLYVGTFDDAPSGWKRPRPLLTSAAVYESAEAAFAAGEEVIAAVRAGDDAAGVER